ncbi:MAG TPA: hypothetical protein VFA75_16335 [Nevskia sp.]|nr:hypothetical protein [Nevskia sp.]
MSGPFVAGDRVYVPKRGWGEVTAPAGCYGYYVKFSVAGDADYVCAEECFDHEHHAPVGAPDPRRPIDVAARERAKLPW